jgi:hypothetical protein
MRFFTGPKLLGAALVVAALSAVPGALATHGGDTRVSSGSPTTPFSQT